jgi:hypothetical protein
VLRKKSAKRGRDRNLGSAASRGRFFLNKEVPSEILLLYSSADNNHLSCRWRKRTVRASAAPRNIAGGGAEVPGRELGIAG